MAPPPVEGEGVVVTSGPKSQMGLLAAGGIALLLAGLAFWKRKEVADVVTTVKSSADFASSMWTTLGEVLPQLSTKSKLIIIAHAAYESGWGQAAKHLALGTNNIFNVTKGSVARTGQWDGTTVTQPDADWEYYQEGKTYPVAPPPGSPWVVDPKNGQYRRRIPQVWRKYPNYRTAILDYWDFLGPNQNGGRYVAARAALEAGDLTTFGNALYKAGYFTLPPGEYVASMTKMLDSVQKVMPT